MSSVNSKKYFWLKEVIDKIKIGIRWDTKRQKCWSWHGTGIETPRSYGTRLLIFFRMNTGLGLLTTAKGRHLTVGVVLPYDSPAVPPYDSPVAPPYDSPVAPPYDSPVAPPYDSPVAPPADDRPAVPPGRHAASPQLGHSMTDRPSHNTLHLRFWRNCIQMIIYIANSRCVIFRTTSKIVRKL